VSFSVNGARTDRFLNPPVVQNYSNQATTGDFSARYERDFSESDRLGLMVRHGLSRLKFQTNNCNKPVAFAEVPLVPC